MKPNTTFKFKNLSEHETTVKHDGGSVMVVFNDGTMGKYKYLDILKINIINSTETLDIGKGFFFQQDRDPKHTAKVSIGIDKK